MDTRLVADLIHYAANGAYDAAVVVSGDDDFVPAVEAVNALGKQVWVATWSAEAVHRPARTVLRSHPPERWHRRVSGGPAARATAERAAVPIPRQRPRTSAAGARRPRPGRRRPPSSSAAWASSQRAEARLPHVSRGYFVMRWKSHLLPPSGPEREHLVQHMLEAGVAEGVRGDRADGRIVVAPQPRA